MKSRNTYEFLMKIGDTMQSTGHQFELIYQSIAVIDGKTEIQHFHLREITHFNWVYLIYHPEFGLLRSVEENFEELNTIWDDILYRRLTLIASSNGKYVRFDPFIYSFHINKDLYELSVTRYNTEFIQKGHTICESGRLSDTEIKNEKYRCIFVEGRNNIVYMEETNDRIKGYIMKPAPEFADTIAVHRSIFATISICNIFKYLYRSFVGIAALTILYFYITY